MRTWSRPGKARPYAFCRSGESSTIKMCMAVLLAVGSVGQQLVEITSLRSYLCLPSQPLQALLH
jgi:hypothetical protein